MAFLDETGLTEVWNLVRAADPKMEVLWQNASPTSSFAAQTISVDLSGFDFIDLLTADTLGGSHRVTRMEVGKTYNIVSCVKGSDNRPVYYLRDFTVSTTGITVSGGTWITNGLFQSGTSAEANVPIRIYGIKGVEIV